MKREEAPVYIWHWVLIIVGILAALVVRSRVQESEPVESVRGRVTRDACDSRFVAVLYPTVSIQAEPESMSTNVFLEHMTELKRAGYRTIGLEQVCDLYNANKLLPEKAVAIILDGRRETCLNAVPVLQELGLRATVMLDVGAMRKTSRSFMSWHDLTILRRTSLWDFGLRTQGAEDLREHLDYLGGHFPDLRVCGISAVTDQGETAELLRGEIVFLSPEDGDGYNSSITDPSCLSLLRIAPRQGSQELVGLLSTILSSAPRIENTFTEAARRLNWVSTCGDTRVVNGMLELSAGPSRSSADAWSVGTHDWRDVDLAVEFKVTGGEQFWAYLRFRNEDSFIRLGCDGERLLLQQKVAGARLKNIKVVTFAPDPSQPCTLRVILRGPFAIASVDGRTLSTRPFRVDDSLVSGSVGFAIWDPECGVARCRIASVAIRKLPCIALMNMDWYPHSSGWITDHSDYLSYICPSGLSLDASQAEQNIDDYKALLISSAYNGHILAPTVALDDKDFEVNDPDVLADKLGDVMKNNGLESVHLDCRELEGGKSSVELGKTLEALKADLPKARLILSLSPECYQSRKEFAKLADVLIVRLQGQQSELLKDVARPFRLKTLLRVETGKPWPVIEGFVSPKTGQAMEDSKGDAAHIVQKYELGGIALCKR